MKRQLKKQRQQRKGKGSGLLESVCGGMVMIIILLGFLDFAALISAQYLADSMVYDCCRAAASASSQSNANSIASSQIQQAFNSSPLVSSISVQSVNYQSANNGGLVTVKLKTRANMIAPLPFLPAQVQMQEQATMPILANLNQNAG